MSTSSPDDPYVLRTDRDGITTLTLNRASQFNALSLAMIGVLQEQLDAISTDPAVRVVVIAGAGKAFCAGHDLKEMRANHHKSFMQDLFQRCGRMMMTLTRMPQPVIARVHGIATAAGCQLVSTCDLAVAVESARFATSGINVGLFCATPAVGLSRNLGRKQALEMLLTGDFIDAQTALQQGLVNRVVASAALDAEVDQLARSILAKSSVAIGMGKQMFYRQLEMGLEAAYQYASEVMACNMMTEDAGEGIDAFIGKRQAEWKGR
jgi:enoyl-CoA hydratase/carnithine racemase